MNKKAVGWLYQQLPELISKGVLSREVADRLRQYYGEVKSLGKRWTILIVCGVLGALLIGLGIIMIFAHNWEQLSRLSRAILSFLPLVIGQGLVLWVLWKRPESHAFKEGTATFLALMVGASIALISQTYHISGAFGTFIMTWMMLILPLVYLMQASIPAAIFLIGITSWAGSHWDKPLLAILFWPLAALVLPHFLWALRQKAYLLRTTILSLVIMVCVCCGAGFSLGKGWPDSWIIIFPSLFAIFYGLGHQNFKALTTNWQRSLRIVGALGIIVLAFQFTFRFVWQDHGYSYFHLRHGVSQVGALPDHLLTLLIVIAASVIFFLQVKRRDFTRGIFGALPLLAFFSYSLRGVSHILPMMIFNLYLFVLSISRIVIGVRNNSLGAINSGMLILALLIIIRFFDSDISFIIKGLAFIIVGAGFLISNLVLVRRGGAK